MGVALYMIFPLHNFKKNMKKCYTYGSYLVFVPKQVRLRETFHEEPPLVLYLALGLLCSGYHFLVEDTAEYSQTFTNIFTSHAFFFSQNNYKFSYVLLAAKIHIDS
jgi:hypothetical protein